MSDMCYFCSSKVISCDGNITNLFLKSSSKCLLIAGLGDPLLGYDGKLLVFSELFKFFYCLT